ncbi:MAG: ribose 5-phosphate isomerase B [candidate division WOR-3 bacterium]|nr:MAG: ribose 5-phosphate isomerase B [candidate division WOR-3 bacterium]
MKIAVGADHRGVAFKTQIMTYLRKKGHEVLDYGTDSTESVDYPDIAIAVGEAVASKKAAYGILLCYSGQGMVMAANKVKGIRAAFCTNPTYARFARAHNNANVLVMPAGFVKYDSRTRNIMKTFLLTRFDGGRHLRRIKKIRKYEDSARRV